MVETVHLNRTIGEVISRVYDETNKALRTQTTLTGVHIDHANIEVQIEAAPDQVDEKADSVILASTTNGTLPAAGNLQPPVKAIHIDSNGNLFTAAMDGAANVITSTVVGPKRGFDVNLIGGAVISVDLDLVDDEVCCGGTSDGGATRQLMHTDVAGDVQVDVLSTANPSNLDVALSTRALETGGNLDTIAGDTTSIDGKITACDTTNLDVALSTRALETGGNLDTIAGDTTSIDGKITACDTTNLDVALSTRALETGGNLDTIAGDTTSIDGKITACDTSNLDVALSTRALETGGNLDTIAGDTTSIDGKITACDTGNVTVVAQPALTSATDSVTAVIDRTPTVTTATGAAAIAVTTALAAQFRLVAITIHLSGVPVTSENLTFSLDANAGAAYDVVFESWDPSVVGEQDYVYTPDNDLIFEAGDEIVVSYLNTDTNTYGLRIVTEAI